MKLLRSVIALSALALAYGCGGPHVTGSDPASDAGSSSSGSQVQSAPDDQARSEIREIREIINNFERVIENIRSEITEIRAEQSNQGERISNLETRADNNDQRVSALESRVDNHDQQIANLERQITQINETIDGLRQQLNQVAQQTATNTADIENLKERVSTLERQVAELQNAVAGIHTDIQGIKDSISEIRELIAGLGNEINELRTSISNVERRFQQQIAQVNNTIRELTERTTVIERHLGIQVVEACMARPDADSVRLNNFTLDQLNINNPNSYGAQLNSGNRLPYVLTNRTMPIALLSVGQGNSLNGGASMRRQADGTQRICSSSNARCSVRDGLVLFDIDVDLPKKSSIKMDRPISANLKLSILKISSVGARFDATEIVCLLNEGACSGSYFVDHTHQALINQSFAGGPATSIRNDRFSQILSSGAQGTRVGSRIHYEQEITISLNDIVTAGGEASMATDQAKKEAIINILYGHTAGDSSFTKKLNFLVGDDILVRDAKLELVYTYNNCDEAQTVTVPANISSSPTVEETVVRSENTSSTAEAPVITQSSSGSDSSSTSMTRTENGVVTAHSESTVTTPVVTESTEQSAESNK